MRPSGPGASGSSGPGSPQCACHPAPRSHVVRPEFGMSGVMIDVLIRDPRPRGRRLPERDGVGVGPSEGLDEVTRRCARGEDRGTEVARDAPKLQVPILVGFGADGQVALSPHVAAGHIGEVHAEDVALERAVSDVVESRPRSALGPSRPLIPVHQMVLPTWRM